MATIDFGDNDGVTTGTTPVTVVAAPTSGVRRIIKSITVKNRDSADRIVTLRKVSAGGTRQLISVTLDPGDQLFYDESTVLNATTDSVTIVTDAAAATQESDWTSSWSDFTP